MGVNPKRMLIADMTFGNTDLETRIRNALQRAGIMNLAQLINRRESQLDDIEGIGIVCKVHIVIKVKALGLTFKPEEPW
jgi:DNA-directed RNA polymerase alpha subunit